MDRSGLGSGVAQHLPRELLHRIVTTQDREEAEYRPFGTPVLELADRLCCAAVCKAWQTALDPATLPLEINLYVGETAASCPVAAWLCRTQPSVRTMRILIEDGLSFHSLAVQAARDALLSIYPRQALETLSLRTDMGAQFWSAVQLFPRLRHLGITAQGAHSTVSVDGSMLRHLPALEELRIASYRNLQLAGSGLLPHLTQLVVGAMGRVALHARLPSLRSLKMAGCERVELAGALPQLTYLVLGCRDFHLSFHDMPALAHLIVYMRSQVRLQQEGFSALAHLTALIIDVQEVDASSASLLLRAAPPCLRSLSLGCLNQQDDITSMPGIGAALGSLAPPASLLPPRCTAFSSCGFRGRFAPPTSLWSTLLRRLSFGSPRTERGPGCVRQRLQVLQRVMGPQCVVHVKK